MKESFNRAVMLARHIIMTGDTVRATAKIYGLGKSTVHKDVTHRLKIIDFALYEQVKRVLDVNFSVRHVRGGEATRKKYLTQKRSS